jgi:hypothetical protein
MQGASAIGLVSMIYLLLKVFLADSSIRMFCIISIILVGIEVFAFLVVRKRRIMMPMSQPASLGNSERDYQALHENKLENDDQDLASNSMLEMNSDPFEILKFTESKFVDVGGVVIHYVYKNNPKSDLTLILIHGFGGGAFSWYVFVFYFENFV